MIKINKKIFWIIGIILIVILLQQQEGRKIASAGLGASRTFNSYSVLPGATITATYTPETFNYFAIIEPVPSGWTPDKSISPDGKVRTSADGTSITIIWTAPSTTGTYTFDGEYFVNPDLTYTNFNQDIIIVSSSSVTTTTIPGATTTTTISGTTTTILGATTTTIATYTTTIPGATTTTTIPSENITCEEVQGCELWEQCNDAKNDCEVAGWVWIVAVIMVFMLFWSMMK